MRQTLEKSRVQEVPVQEMPRVPSEADLQRWIAEAAYYRAEQRGFQPGYEAEDWLAAEAEVTARLRVGAGVI